MMLYVRRSNMANNSRMSTIRLTAVLWLFPGLTSWRHIHIVHKLKPRLPPRQDSVIYLIVVGIVRDVQFHGVIENGGNLDHFLDGMTVCLVEFLGVKFDVSFWGHKLYNGSNEDDSVLKTRTHIYISGDVRTERVVHGNEKLLGLLLLVPNRFLWADPTLARSVLPTKIASRPPTGNWVVESSLGISIGDSPRLSSFRSSSADLERPFWTVFNGPSKSD